MGRCNWPDGGSGDITQYAWYHITNEALSWSGGSQATDNWNTANHKTGYAPQVTNQTWNLEFYSPLIWDHTTDVNLRLWWYMDDGSSADTHTFEGGMMARSNDEYADTAFNYDTAFQFSARAGSDDYVYVADFDVTPQMSPQPGDFLMWKWRRTDSESGDPRFLGGYARFTLQ